MAKIQRVQRLRRWHKHDARVGLRTLCCLVLTALLVIQNPAFVYAGDAFAQGVLPVSETTPPVATEASSESLDSAATKSESSESSEPSRSSGVVEILGVAEAPVEPDTPLSSELPLLPQPLIGALQVFVTFEGEDFAPVAVELQLQSQTRKWNSAATAWEAWSEEWVAVGDAVLVDAPANERARATASAAYQFKNLPVQTVVLPGEGQDVGVQLQDQRRYRVIETKVDGKVVEYAKHPVDNLLTGEVHAAQADSSARASVVLGAAASLVPQNEDGVLLGEAQLALAQTTVKNMLVPGVGSFTAAPAALSAAGSYTVFSKSFNNDGTCTYTLDKTAWVTVYDAQGAIASGPSATNQVVVPTNGSFTVDPNHAGNVLTGNLTVTLGTYPNAADPSVSVMPASKSATLSASQLSATFVTQRPVPHLALQKGWNDNANERGVRPALSDFQGLLSLEFTVDGGTTWTPLNESTKGDLGYASLPSLPAGSEINFATWEYAFVNTLNHVDKSGNAVGYRLAEQQAAPALANYVATYASGTEGNEILTNTSLNPYAATKSWKDYDNAYHTRLDVATWLANVRLYRAVNADSPESVVLSATDTAAEGYIEITQNADDTWSLSIPNALGFDEAGLPYAYYLVEPLATGALGMPVSSSADVAYQSSWYVPKYDNVDNFASNMRGLYADGVLTNTLSDTYTFTGTKVWADDHSQATRDERPAAEWVLYRFPQDGMHSYQTASPVATPTATLDQTNNDGETITFPRASAPGAQVKPLPRYDLDGHEYVYFVKETLTGGSVHYDKVFDNTPSGVSDQDGGNILLFHDGKLTNLRASTTSLLGVKTWVAGALSEQQSEVSLTLYRSAVKYDQAGLPVIVNGAYEYEPAVEVSTQTLKDFNAVYPSQTASFDGLPQFDAHGLPFKYEIRETGVKTLAHVGEPTEGMQDARREIAPDGSVQFITADGYRYKQATTIDAAGRTQITNTLIGNAEVDITKTFPDGIIGGSATIVYDIQRDGVLMGSLTHTYTDTSGTGAYTYDPALSDNSIHEYSETVKVTDFAQLDGASETGLLPRYDPTDGHEYTYLLTEKSVTPGGYAQADLSFVHTDQLYDPQAGAGVNNEHYLLAAASVSNPVGGPGASVLVKKQWVDNYDTECRRDVVVGLFDTAGNPLMKDGVQLTGTITPNEDRVRIALPAGIDTSNVRVRELFVNGQPVTQADAITPDFLAAHVGLDSGSAWVASGRHEYNVSVSDSVDAEGAWVVTNRRIGSVSIDLTKTWVDGSNVRGNRPVSVDFNVTNDGVGGAANGVLDPFTVTLTSDPSGPSNANVWQTTTVQLPKYDRMGKIIHYSVEEVVTPDMVAGDYQVSVQSSYVVGMPNRTLDKASFRFTNTRTGTIQPNVNKYWKDDNRLNVVRPDLVPVMYERFEKIDPNNPEATYFVTRKVSNYVDRDWFTQLPVGDGHWWKCVFDSMPKYTSEGFRIFYYIGETVAVPGEFSYEAFYREAPDGTTGAFSEQGLQPVVLQLTDDNGNPQGEIGAAPMGGTMVNKLQAERTLSGLKIWKTMPTGIGKSWYPTITFDLYAKDAQGVEQLVSPAQSAVLKNGAAAFTFSQPVPKYDSEGLLIEYSVKERGLPHQGVTFDILAVTAETGFEVSNTFNINQNYQVVFDKTWDQLPAGLTGAQRPQIALTLVRYMRMPLAIDYDMSTRAVVATTNLVYDGAPTQEVTWGQLPYYAPNGEPYRYVVEESHVNGYTQNVGDVMGAPYDDVAMVGQGAALATNTYNGGRTVELAIEKVWAESPYDLSARPDSVMVHVQRKTADGAFDERVTNDLQLTSADATNDANKWSRVINPAADLVAGLDPHGIVEFAPNGQPYIYYLVETVPDGYAFSSQTVTPASAATTTTFTLSGTNTVNKQVLAVEKMWEKQLEATVSPLVGDELLLAYQMNAIPQSITYQVQYSLDGGTTWGVLKKTGASPADVEMTSTFDTAQKTYVSSAPLSDLPATTLVDGVSTPIQYRAVEKTAQFQGGLTVNRDLAAGTIGTAGVSEATSTVGSTTTTKATNTLPMKQVEVTKLWEDETNRDGTRPTSLSFDLVRSVCNAATDTQTTQVVLDKNNATSDANAWTKTLSVPLYWNVDTTQMSGYTLAENLDAAAALVYTVRQISANNVNFVDGTTLDLGQAGTAAWFKNHRVGHDVITTNAAKIWRALNNGSYTGALKDLGGTSYRPATLSFVLQFRTSAQDTWSAVDDPTRVDRPLTLANGPIVATQTVALNADGSLQTVPSWGELPRHQVASSVDVHLPYFYRVVEVPIPAAFDASYNLSSLDATTAATTTQFLTTNTLKTTSLAMTKTWNDSNNRYQTRPDAITFNVQWSTDGTTWNDIDASQGEWTQKASFTLTAANGWMYTVSGLPKANAAGIPYQYRAVEKALTYSGKDILAPGSDGNFGMYHASNSGMVLAGQSIENTLGSQADIAAHKVWDDHNNQDGKRPEAVSVELQRRAQTSTSDQDWNMVEAQVLNAANNWAYTWTQVPQYVVSQGVLVQQQYRVVETQVPAEYTLSISGDPVVNPTTFTLTNSYTPRVMQVEATKTWNDQNNFFGTRPAQLSFTLEYSLDAGSTWKPVDATLGTSIQATQTIALVQGELNQNPVWTGLPVNVNPTGTSATPGTTVNVQYRVVEAAFNAYATTYAPATVQGVVTSSDNNQTIAVTNTLKTTSLMGTKQWSDGSNKYGLRPSLATYKGMVKLYLNYTDGSTKKEVVGQGEQWTWTAARDAWNYEIASVPLPAPGTFYSVEEALVPAYVADPASGSVAVALTPDGRTLQAETLKNTLVTGSLSVSKAWVDDNNRDGKRPSHLDVGLVASVENTPITLPSVVTSVALSDTNTWTYTWSDLPLQTAEGKAITYTTTEATVADYTAAVSVGGAAEQAAVSASTTLSAGATVPVIFKNTHVPEMIDVTVSKEWDDDSNALGMRPTSLLVTLFGAYHNGSGVVKEQVGQDSFTNQTGDVWTYTFTGLPKYKAGEVGKEIYYTVEEEAVQGYTLTYVNGNQLNMMNAANTVVLKGEKQWNDESNEYGLRPDAETFKNSVKLYVEFPDGTQREVTNAAWTWNTDGNVWSYEIKGLRAPRAGVFYVVKEAVSVPYAEDHAGVVAAAGTEGVLIAPALVNTLQTTQLGVVKTWNDFENAYNLRPLSVMVTVQQSVDGATWHDLLGSSGNPVTVMLDGTEPVAWTATVSGLPRVSPDGATYSYRAVETSVVVGGKTITRTEGSSEIGAYEVTETTAGGTTTLVNVLQTGSLKVTKAWDDGNNQDGKRPEKLAVTLGAKVGQTPVVLPPSVATSVELSAEGWMYEWSNLPLRVASGATLDYLVEETLPAEYRAQVAVGVQDAQEGTIGMTPLAVDEVATVAFTNTYTPKTLSVTAQKVWDDQDNLYASRPVLLNFTLEYSLDGAATWKPVDAALVANVEAEKTVVVENGEVVQAPVWSGLPVSTNPTGTTTAPGAVVGVLYRVVEHAVVGYDSTYSSDGQTYGVNPTTLQGSVAQPSNELTAFVKNTLQTTNVDVVKTWDDAENAYHTRSEVSVQLQFRLGDAAPWVDCGAPRALDLTVATEEMLAFDNLPLTALVDGTPVIYQYRVVETSLTNYTTTVSDPVSAEQGKTETITVTNKLVLVGLEFDKVGFFVESCSDPALGASDPADMMALPGAEFTAYIDEACTQEAHTVQGTPAQAVSDDSGHVVFDNLLAATYWIKETMAPAEYVTNDTVYVATFTATGELQSFVKQGETTPVTQVVNDRQRTDITLVKVAETDTTKLLPNAEYGLYKRVAAVPSSETFARAAGVSAIKDAMVAAGVPAVDGYELIAKATTNAQGRLVFKGLLMEQDYLIKEFSSPEGSYLSKNPATFTLRVGGDGAPAIAVFDGGAGTAESDGVSTITWKEPQVIVDLAKKTSDGALLAGAKLQVIDAAGKVVGEPWVSSAEAGHRIEGVLAAGKTYRLVELEAPAGYMKAADVEFTVESLERGPNEHFVHYVEMIDEVSPVAPSGSGSSSKRQALLLTGDNLNVSLLALGGIGVVSLGVLGAILLRKSRKNSRRR